jgi:group I intron endonuclease
MMIRPLYGSVYRITCDANGKCYIGLTRGYVSDRWYQHKKAAAMGASSALYSAIRKHGVERFRIEHIASAVDPASLAELERALIAQHETRARGYNLSDGGERAFFRLMSDEGRDRIRAVRNTPEAISANRLRNKERTGTPEGAAHQARMVELARAAKGNLIAGRKRYAATPEGREQLTAAAKMGAAKNAELTSKPVLADGAVFRSVAEAAAKYGIERGAVRWRIKSPRFGSWSWA